MHRFAASAESSNPIERAMTSWRESRLGFAPLYCEPIMAAAFEFLLTGLPPGARVLDLGAGEGQVAAGLRSAGCAPIALEFDRPLLAAARTAGRVDDACRARAESLPFGDGTLDAVFCFSVFQYTDRRRALEELYRVLKPGGRFAVIENLEGSPVAKAHRVIKRLTGVRDPERLTLHRHLRWSDRSLYARVFPDSRCEAFDLMAPLLLLSGPIYRASADLPADSWRRRTCAAVRRVDEFVLRAVPTTAHAAWLALVLGRR